MVVLQVVALAILLAANGSVDELDRYIYQTKTVRAEVLSTIEKNQVDNDGVISSQDATCEGVKEIESRNEITVAYAEELNETPREFKEEAEGNPLILR